MYIYICVCVCVCFVCIYVCVYIYVCVCVCVYIYLRITMTYKQCRINKSWWIARPLWPNVSWRYVFPIEDTATSRATSSHVGVTSPHDINLMGRIYNYIIFEIRNWCYLRITMTRKSGKHLHVKHWTAVSTLLGLISSAHRDLHHWGSNQQPQYAEA